MCTRMPSISFYTSRKEAGFTLVEILVAILLFIVLISVVFACFEAGHMSWSIDMGLLDINQPLRLSMDGMSREIRQSSPGGVVINEDGDRIDFAVNTSNVAYYISNGRLIREHPVGENKILAQNITALNFMRNESTIEIEASAQKRIYGDVIGVTLKEKVRLRNEDD